MRSGGQFERCPKSPNRLARDQNTVDRGPKINSREGVKELEYFVLLHLLMQIAS
jgi:hypothetical protein